MRAEPRNEGKFQWLARLGFFVRGLLYIVIALLVIGTGRTEDLTGALEYLGRGAGRALLIFMAAGMTGYGLWRVSDAAFGMDSGKHETKAWKRRIAAAGSGAIYLFLAFKAVRIILEGRTGAGGPQENASAALHLPSGQYVLGGAALAIVAAGAVQLHKAATCSFLRPLDDRAQRTWAKWLGRIGYAARGIIFLAVAYLLWRAALDRRPGEAGGLEQALDLLRGPAEYALAAGLLLFGLFSIVEARYRSIHKPPVEQIKRDVADEVAA